MIIGVWAHSRKRRVTSSPLMSGRLRSRRITSGRSVAAARKASAPLAASQTSYCPLSDALRKRRMGRSSSTTRMHGMFLVIGFKSRLNWQRQGNNRPPGRAILCPNVPTVGLDDSLADRQPQASATDRFTALDAVELVEDMLQFGGRDAQAAVEKADVS